MPSKIEPVAKALGFALLWTLCIALTTACNSEGLDFQPPARLASTAVVLSVGQRPVCSGVLIAPRVVLTAAHCVVQSRPDTVVLRAGISAPRIPIASTHAHPGFVYSTLANDIAVVLLARGAGGDVLPLGSPNQVPEVGRIVLLAGYGSKVRQRSFRRIHVGTLMIDALLPQVISARPVSTTACANDSGGAVAAADKLVAIVSGGDWRCSGRSLFTRLDVHRHFITNAIDAVCSVVDSQCAIK